jgi:2-methylfumaryl-CoA isomerase
MWYQVSYRDVVASDDMRANPMMSVIDQPGVGRHVAPASPVAMSASVDREPVRAPVLGEHTEQILRTDLGLSAQTSISKGGVT